MNRSNNKQKTAIRPLNIEAEKCSSLFSIFKGFMFSRRKNAKAKLFIFSRELHADIHMFFVFFPIVVIWIDKNKKVVECSLAKPFSFYKTHKAKYVLEIPCTRKTKKLLKMKGRQLKWD